MLVIKRETLLHGPNLLLPVPAVALLIVRAGGFDDITEQRLQRLSGTITRVIQSAGSTAELGPVDGELLQRAPALAVGDLIARTALALLKDFHYPAERKGALPQRETDHVLVAYESGDPALGQLAGQAAVGLWAAALGNPESPPQTLQTLYDAFKKRADAVAPVIETRLLLQEAGRRGIPWFRLADNTPIYLLGQGARQRRFHNSMSDETADMAYRLATIKPVAARLLHEHGVPIPLQGLADTVEHALAHAQNIGFPVVIKPVNQDRGTGVRTALANAQELAAAFPATRSFGTVQVEKHLEGFDYRFTFIRGALVGVLCTMPPILVGDGKASIRQLLDAEPVTTATFARKKVIVDEEVLRRIGERGYSLSDVLPAGERIVLRRWWRNQPDHMLENVTDVTHPENIEAARLAVRLIGLDISGVDFITTDISRPYHETGGAFTEVNPIPALAGVQRCGMPAYRLLLEAFFPAGDDGRIPTVVLLGSADAGPAVGATQSLLADRGYCIGVGTRGRFDIGGTSLRREDADEKSRIRTVLCDPRTTMAIVQATPEAIDRDGLALDRCDVGVIMPDRQAQGWAAADDRSTQAAALLAGLSRKAVVVDLDDPRAAAIAAAAAGTRIVWLESRPGGAFDRSPVRPGDAVVALGPAEGGYSVTLSDNGGTANLGAAAMESSSSDVGGDQARYARLIAMAIAHGLGRSATAIAAAAARLAVSAAP